MLRMLVLLAAVALASNCMAAAEIEANGFRVRHDVAIAASPAKVYDALIGHVDRWWSAKHTYSGDSRNLTIDARAGGCFCERLANGGVEHMRVVYVRPNEMLRMTGGLGPLQASGIAGAMTWRLSPAQAATKLELTYSVGGYIAEGFQGIAPAVESVLGEQVDRLKRYVESGAADAPK
jgi:uncharacterized protein YndB with AHSA1/START domain